MSKGDWGNVDLYEALGLAAMSGLIGFLHYLHAIRTGGKRFRWLDAIIEPSFAVFGGLATWGLLEITDTPDVLQAVFTSLGAWGGPRTIHKLEMKYMGGTRQSDIDSRRGDL